MRRAWRAVVGAIRRWHPGQLALFCSLSLVIAFLLFMGIIRNCGGLRDALTWASACWGHVDPSEIGALLIGPVLVTAVLWIWFGGRQAPR